MIPLRSKAGTGAHARIRTGDLFLTKEMLYRLSYVGGAAVRFYLLHTLAQIHADNRRCPCQRTATSEPAYTRAGGGRTVARGTARRHTDVGAAHQERIDSRRARRRPHSPRVATRPNVRFQD